MSVIAAIGPRSAHGFEQISVDGTAGGTGFTASKITTFDNSLTYEPRRRSSLGVTISTETASIRFTIDGTAPTSTVGHAIAAGSFFEIWGLENLNKFRAIGVGGTAVLTVTYYGE